MQGERIQILKMVEEGKITSEEAVKLLESIEDNPGPSAGVGGPRRMLRVRVVKDGHPKVSVNLPVNLAKMALKLASRFDERLVDIDVDDLVEEIRKGVDGPLIEVEDGSEKVIITVE